MHHIMYNIRMVNEYFIIARVTQHKRIQRGWRCSMRVAQHGERDCSSLPSYMARHLKNSFLQALKEIDQVPLKCIPASVWH